MNRDGRDTDPTVQENSHAYYTGASNQLNGTHSIGIGD